jgi:hypothetical protein
LFAIQEVLRGIDPEILDAVFQEWMIWLPKCIEGNGEYGKYVEWWLNWKVQFLFLNSRSWEAMLQWNTLSLANQQMISTITRQ